MTTRVMPVAEKVIIAALAAGMDTGVSFGTRMVTNRLEQLPYVNVVRSPGTGAVDFVELDYGTFILQYWTKDSDGQADGNDACAALALAGRAALRAAHVQQMVVAGGSIASYVETSGPSDIDVGNMPHGVYVREAIYTLAVRPAKGE